MTEAPGGARPTGPIRGTSPSQPGQKPENIFVKVLKKLGNAFMKVITLGAWKGRVKKDAPKKEQGNRVDAARAAALPATTSREPAESEGAARAKKFNSDKRKYEIINDIVF
jgi:hypothetical protein